MLARLSVRPAVNAASDALGLSAPDQSLKFSPRQTCRFKITGTEKYLFFPFFHVSTIKQNVGTCNK
jgi:hypothetical protein